MSNSPSGTVGTVLDVVIHRIPTVPPVAELKEDGPPSAVMLSSEPSRTPGLPDCPTDYTKGSWTEIEMHTLKKRLQMLHAASKIIKRQRGLSEG